MISSFSFNRSATRCLIWCYILITVISFTGLKLYYLVSYSKNSSPKHTSGAVRVSTTLKHTYKRDPYYKYILVWPNATKFKLLEKGDKTFVTNNCEHKNCFATDNVNLLSSVREFDAVVFNGLDITILQKNEVLKERSPKQKYIFAAFESAVYVPICFEYFDGFFNLTWTYKLDSDFVATFFNIYDMEGKIVGPRVNMSWVRKMHPINEEIKSILSRKTKAAAAFISRCNTLSKREAFVKRLKVQLYRFGLTVDVYGECGTRKCPRNESEKCDNMIKEDYFFYLAFENSMASDYVTETLSRALNNYAVPIVFGGSDNTRFVPKGAYLDATEFGEWDLAYTINELMDNRTAYHDFFRWRNHYAYSSHDRVLRKDVCQLCAMLNDEEQLSKVTVWRRFREWWNEGNFDCRYHEIFDEY